MSFDPDWFCCRSLSHVIGVESNSKTFTVSFSGFVELEVKSCKKKMILINSLFIYLYLFNNTNVSQYSISLDLKDAIINKQTLEAQLLLFQLRLHVSAHLSILM